MTEYPLYERDGPNISGLERELYDAVSDEEPWGLVEKFSELERVSGTEDEREAFEYLTGRLAELGIPYEQFNPELYISRPNSAELEIPDVPDVTFETPKTVAFSGDETVRGEALYIDTSGGDDDLAGAFDVGLSLDDIDADVEGKIVVIESILPINVICELADADAAGFVGIHPHDDEPHEGIASPIWGGVPDPQGSDEIPDITIANVSRLEGDKLLEVIENRDSVELEISADVTTGWESCPAVVSRIPGEKEPDNDDFVLLHGHVDSWHVGITDNATGDAGLLETARVFNEHSDRLKRDLWVAWWPAHSTGRYAGSTWFVDEFAGDIRDRCVAHVNMDSLGVADATEFVGRPKWMPEADGLCRSAIDDVCGKETEENRPPRAGDYSFNNLGIPGLSIFSCIPEEIREKRGYHSVGGSGGNSDAWHLSTDTIEKADPDVLVRDIQVFAVAINRLLNDDVLPLDHRHSLVRHRETISEYDDHVGDHFDFAPLREALASLESTVETFHDAVESGDVSPEAANGAIKDLSRTLVRLNFTTEGVFEQDPAMYRPPYPSLAAALQLDAMSGDEYRFQKTHLKRARNEAVYRLQSVEDRIPTSSR